MIMQKELKIELSGQEAENIIADFVAEKMKGMGYKVEYSRNEDGPFPDTFWRGVEIEKDDTYER